MWHVIIFLVQQIWSDEIRRGFWSLPIDNTHDRMMSGVACNYNSLTAETFGGLQTWLDIALGLHTQIDDVKPGIPSLPLEIIHDQMMSRVTCHHLLLNTQTVDQ